MTDRKNLKAAARESIRASRPHPYWVTAVTAVILGVLSVLLLSINGTFDSLREMYAAVMAGEMPDLYATTRTISAFGSFLVLALEIMSMVVSVGYELYCMRVARREKASFGDVFDAFGIFFRAMFIRMLRSLVITLWAMGIGLIVSLFLSAAMMIGAVGNEEQMIELALDSPWVLVVGAAIYAPMIIVSYFYRLADYFMLDHPEMSCAQCLTMSRMAMRGRKWELFRLDLSFLGWILLSVIPFVGFWVQPYITVTEIGFYNSVAPAFLSDLEKRMRERAQSLRPTSTARHGYHVPGRGDDDDSDDPDME